MKVYLCGERGCCPSVDVQTEYVYIGEGDNTCRLTLDEWNELKDMIKNDEF